MRVKLGVLRQYMREVAMTANTAPANVGLIVRESREYVSMALVDLQGVKNVLSGASKNPHATLSFAIIGGITAGKFDVWRVTNVKADKGYGPMLYRSAMQYATRKGSSLSSDPHGATSPAAQSVWDKFAAQPDVEVVFLDEKYGDQRDIAYCLEGDDSFELVQRYTSLLAQFDKRAVDALDEIIDYAISEATVTFGA